MSSFHTSQIVWFRNADNSNLSSCSWVTAQGITRWRFIVEAWVLLWCNPRETLGGKCDIRTCFMQDSLIFVCHQSLSLRLACVRLPPGDRQLAFKGRFTRSMPCPCRANAVPMPCPCRAHAVPLPCRAVNSHMPCRAPALLRQCRVLRESPRGSRKYPNC